MSGVVRECCACLVVSVNDVLGVTIESGAFTGGAAAGGVVSGGVSEQVCRGRRPLERESSMRQALQSEDMFWGAWDRNNKEE